MRGGDKMKKVVLGEVVEIPELKTMQDIKNLAEKLGIKESLNEEILLTLLENMDSYGIYATIAYAKRAESDENVEIKTIEDFRNYLKRYDLGIDEKAVQSAYYLYEWGYIDKDDLIMGVLKHLAEIERALNEHLPGK